MRIERPAEACPHQRLVLSEEMGELALRYTAQGSRVLEVACGSGWLARQLACLGRTVMACDLTLPEAGLGEAAFVEATFPIGERHALWSLVQQVLKLGLEVDSYSGRGMFGAKCPAVYVRRVGEMRLDCAYRQDVMGLGFVLYADC